MTFACKGRGIRLDSSIEIRALELCVVLQLDCSP